MNSFGVFQAYYTDYLKITPSEISWIGAIQNFLGYFLSTLSGRLSDAGHFRLSLSIGTGLLILGSFTMSFSTKYWQLMLTQGVTMGLAAGFLCCPMMSVTGTYFSKNRSLVLGIITCGNVTGGLIYPAMARQLLPAVGFGWALRAIAFIQAATMIAVTFIARARVKPNTTGPMLELSAFKEPEFSFYTFGMFFVSNYPRTSTDSDAEQHSWTHHFSLLTLPRVSPALTLPSTICRSSAALSLTHHSHTRTALISF